MKRSTGEKATRVYQYGPARGEVINEEEAMRQLRLANRQWNCLVAIERCRHTRYIKIMHDEAQERIDQLRNEIDALREEIKARRKKARTRKVEIADLTGPLAEKRAERNALIAEQQNTKEARHESKRSALDALQESTQRRIKRTWQAAGGMGLFWGTYNDVTHRRTARLVPRP